MQGKRRRRRRRRRRLPLSEPLLVAAAAAAANSAAALRQLQGHRQGLPEFLGLQPERHSLVVLHVGTGGRRSCGGAGASVALPGGRGPAAAAAA